MADDSRTVEELLAELERSNTSYNIRWSRLTKRYTVLINWEGIEANDKELDVALWTVLEQLKYGREHANDERNT